MHTNKFSKDVASFFRSPVREIFKRVDLNAIYSFAGGYPSAETFPMEEIKKTMSEVIDKYQGKAFQYGATQGVPELRDAVAKRNGVKRENVVCGNGSDDILTMTFRAFTSPENPLACLWPTYSLYNILAEMQSAPVKHVLLDKETFAFPENALEQAEGANLFIITRPNAPTGNTVDKAVVREICAKFDGVVM